MLPLPSKRLHNARLIFEINHPEPRYRASAAPKSEHWKQIKRWIVQPIVKMHFVSSFKRRLWLACALNKFPSPTAALKNIPESQPILAVFSPLFIKDVIRVFPEIPRSGTKGLTIRDAEKLADILEHSTHITKLCQ